jgi:hypothetical protein
MAGGATVTRRGSAGPASRFRSRACGPASGGRARAAGTTTTRRTPTRRRLLPRRSSCTTSASSREAVRADAVSGAAAHAADLRLEARRIAACAGSRACSRSCRRAPASRRGAPAPGSISRSATARRRRRCTRRRRHEAGARRSRQRADHGRGVARPARDVRGAARRDLSPGLALDATRCSRPTRRRSTASGRTGSSSTRSTTRKTGTCSRRSTKSMKKRRQPLLIIITHAGEDDEGIATRSTSTRSACSPAPSRRHALPVIFEATSDDDWTIGGGLAPGESGPRHHGAARPRSPPSARRRRPSRGS